MSGRRAPARPQTSRTGRHAPLRPWWPALAATVLVAVACAFAAPARGQDTTASSYGPPIPEPVGYVNDAAGVLSEPQRAKLEAFLDQVHEKTGAQFAVLTMRSTAPVEPSEYKVRVFEKWGIGDRDRDDGLLMLVAIEERQVRFETGYGLEGVLPDGLQSRIFRDDMAPSFRNGDYDTGIANGVVACAARIAAEKGVTLEWDGRELRYSRKSGRRGLPPALIVMLLAFLFLWIVVAVRVQRHPASRRRGAWWYGDWTGGSGGGGWGGGFGGGGFGGGGGGGGSFGGFGGGGSGGGGGGGSW